MSLVMNGLHISREHIDLCYSMAEKALSLGEVPVGCVFILHNSSSVCKLIASDHNKTNISKNGTRHAEMECIDTIVKLYGSNKQQLMNVMSNCSVLLTLEPCIMCARALRSLNVCQVLYGASNDRFGAITLTDITSNKSINESILKCYQVLDADLSIELLQQFYAQYNDNAPNPKPKKLKLKV